VREGHARALRVEVSSTDTGFRGIGWRTLGQIPVRDIVAAAIREALRRATVGEGGVVQLSKPGSREKAVDEIVQATVGYTPSHKGFKRVREDG
jgi:hypothetical protein